MTRILKTGQGKVISIKFGEMFGMYLIYNFDSNGDSIKMEFRPFLQKLGNLARGSRLSGVKLRIKIEGHADTSGGDADNLSLSMLRALKVRELLIKYGAVSKQCSIAAHGEDPKQLASKSPFSMHERNPKISRRGGNELDRSVAVTVFLIKPDHSQVVDLTKGGWDKVLAQAQDIACWTVHSDRLARIAKTLIPWPCTPKGKIPIPITSPPSAEGSSQEQIKKEIRKAAIDVIMDWNRRSGHDITRSQVEQEYDKRYR